MSSSMENPGQRRKFPPGRKVKLGEVAAGRTIAMSSYTDVLNMV
jgi:hypothetical protein